LIADKPLHPIACPTVLVLVEPTAENPERAILVPLTPTVDPLSMVERLPTNLFATSQVVDALILLPVLRTLTALLAKIV
jgi:hypothetical protein